VRTVPSWPGTTTVWRAIPRRGADVPAVTWDLAEIEISRSESGDARAELALVFGGRERPREHLVLESETVSSGGIQRFFVPAPRRIFPAGGYELELARVAPPAEPELARAIEAGRSALEAASARARGLATAPTEDESFRFESGTALPALERPALRRPALAFLATVARAPLAGDLALDASPEALARYAAELVPLIRGESLDDATLPSVGWALERTAYVWLAGAALDEKRPLDPELRSLLLAHAGALGSFPELLRDAVLECNGLDALEKRLVQENRIFLEDADAGARVRAFDWLAGRGSAPDAFDPLGSLADRRAALERTRATAERAK
jgi:hypothetical protein